MTYQITINGKSDFVEGRSHSYEEIVAMAFADPAGPQAVEGVLYTVTYRRACHGKEGTLIPGQRVDVAAGTIFNVADTSNA